jgi:hypothetical protein
MQWTRACLFIGLVLTQTKYNTCMQCVMTCRSDADVSVDEYESCSGYPLGARLDYAAGFAGNGGSGARWD